MGIIDKIFHRLKKNGKEQQNAKLVDSADIWFTTPTISNEFPNTSATTKNTAFDIHIHEDDYRQKEFLNVASLPLIEKEFVAIKNIWDNHSKKSNTYTLFSECHVRNVIGTPNLKIDFNELKSILQCNKVGQILINGETVQDGFSLSTENTRYFGTLQSDMVLELCISQWNKNTIDEIKKINSAFRLLFVNWYHRELIND